MTLKSPDIPYLKHLILELPKELPLGMAKEFPFSNYVPKKHDEGIGAAISKSIKDAFGWDAPIQSVRIGETGEKHTSGAQDTASATQAERCALHHTRVPYLLDGVDGKKLLSGGLLHTLPRGQVCRRKGGQSSESSRKDSKYHGE